MSLITSGIPNRGEPQRQDLGELTAPLLGLRLPEAGPTDSGGPLSQTTLFRHGKTLPSLHMDARGGRGGLPCPCPLGGEGGREAHGCGPPWEAARWVSRVSAPTLP